MQLNQTKNLTFFCNQPLRVFRTAVSQKKQKSHKDKNSLHSTKVVVHLSTTNLKCCWFGHLACKIVVSEMTMLSGGMINSTLL